MTDSTDHLVPSDTPGEVKQRVVEPPRAALSR